MPKIHDRVFTWALAAIIIGMAACGPRMVQAPMLALPDTRLFREAVLDTGAVRQTMATILAALPNETGLCFAVAIRREFPFYGATVERADAAATLYATPFAVWYDLEAAPSGCPSKQQLAVGHSHPYAIAPDVCTHSDADALFLASDPRLLFSVVFCGDGRGELLWQDHRRHAFQWERP